METRLKKSYLEGYRAIEWAIASLPESGYRPAQRKAGTMQEKRRKPTMAEFEAFHGSTDLGAFARIVYPWYFWWMSREFATARTPQDIALIHAKSPNVLGRYAGSSALRRW